VKGRGYLVEEPSKQMSRAVETGVSKLRWALSAVAVAAILLLTVGAALAAIRFS